MPVTFREWRARADRRYLVLVLKRAGNNVAKASQLAGLHKGHFYGLMQRHGIRPPNETRRAKTIAGLVAAREAQSAGRTPHA